MLASILSKTIQLLDPFLTVITSWHLVYFLTFLASVLVLYLLSRRWMSRWAAFGAALLFSDSAFVVGACFYKPQRYSVHDVFSN